MVEYYCDVTDHLSILKKILVDGGYTGENFANSIKALSGVDVEIVKRNELHTFAVLPKRWIVERSFAWLDKCRRLWKNCERYLQKCSWLLRDEARAHFRCQWACSGFGLICGGI